MSPTLLPARPLQRPALGFGPAAIQPIERRKQTRNRLQAHSGGSKTVLSYYLSAIYRGPTPMTSSGLTRSQAMEPSTARPDATRNDAVQPNASPMIGVSVAVVAPPI